MRSNFLGAESILTKSHKEGDETVYNIELKFIDLLGNKRRHIFPASIPSNITVGERVSFTAISEVQVLTGLVVSISNVHISVATNEGLVQIERSKNYNAAIGEQIILLEHMDMNEKPYRLKLIPVPEKATSDIEALRLQSVNADILDDSNKVIFRLSADPLFKIISCEAMLNE